MKIKGHEEFDILSLEDKVGVVCAMTMGTRYGSEYDWLARPIEYYEDLAVKMGLIIDVQRHPKPEEKP